MYVAGRALFFRLSKAQTDLYWVVSYLSALIIDMIPFHWLNNLHIQIMTKLLKNAKSNNIKYLN